MGLAEWHPPVGREMALLIGCCLRVTHDSVQSLSVESLEACPAAALLRVADREGARTQRDRK